MSENISTTKLSLTFYRWQDPYSIKTSSQNLFNKTSFLPHKGITGKLRLIRLDIKNIQLKPIDCLAILSINVINQNKYLVTAD